ncbi:MAG: hypothetical protein P8Y80_04025 [Acidobacteriota bacterium]
MILGLVVAVFPWNTATAQDVNSNAGSEQTESAKSTRLNYAGVSFIPDNRRDPFLNPLLKKAGAAGDQEIDRGLPPPGIAGTYIAEAVLKGVSIRETGRRLAIVKGSGNLAYFLREGDRLFDGYLKAIHRDSITLVRERKMRSGKIITQEVIKRLRTP